MPGAIRQALVEPGLLAAYEARPPYQRNDYLAWIARARRDATRDQRIRQMLDELAGGGRYMKMAWRPGGKS
ncbi:hypothetical protein FAZ21_10065 [Chitiniphilus eburneus]|uniref:YdeI/OmpD-associated family protein n=2 Tax=Chitiniphilus eburneus TaxID=2571148 RepID=A0A4U0PZ97_9NEIS|nr:hypothetical protein FAZ21_10065 [Chitiniphilus eburneus]